MDWPTMELVLAAAEAMQPGLVDITGPRHPELNPCFRRFVRALAGAGRAVQVRTNLTALLAPGMAGLIEFLRECEVRLVGSMPCYLEENVAAQRGVGAYAKSVEALRRLNAAGYGVDGGLPSTWSTIPAGPPCRRSRLDWRRTIAGNWAGGLAYRSPDC